MQRKRDGLRRDLSRLREKEEKATLTVEQMEIRELEAKCEDIKKKIAESAAQDVSVNEKKSISQKVGAGESQSVELSKYFI